MTAVDQAIQEIENLLVVFAPRHEGLRDFERLNLKEATLSEIRTSISLYDRRKELLEGALRALDLLVADGHPDLPVREISALAYADLQENTSTIEAAMSRFASNTAVGIELTPGEVQKK